MGFVFCTPNLAGWQNSCENHWYGSDFSLSRMLAHLADVESYTFGKFDSVQNQESTCPTSAAQKVCVLLFGFRDKSKNLGNPYEYIVCC